MRIFRVVAPLLACLALAGCGSAKPEASAEAAVRCPQAWSHGWQKLANRVGAAVYCPSWMPNPLDAKIGGQWTDIDAVDRDGSYLISFIYQESQSGEVHVNLRRYSGTQMPRCRDLNSTKQIACFSDPHGTLRVGGIDATLYTVGRDADQWHLTYLWRHGGATYAVGEHVAPPFTYAQVTRNVQRLVRSLVLLQPA